MKKKQQKKVRLNKNLSTLLTLDKSIPSLLNKKINFTSEEPTYTNLSKGKKVDIFKVTKSLGSFFNNNKSLTSIIDYEPDTRWLDSKVMQQYIEKFGLNGKILSIHHSLQPKDSDELIAIDSLESLTDVLKNIPDDVVGVLPIKVNAITKKMNTNISDEQQTNHWVGLYINTTNKQIVYADPMGEEISAQVKNEIERVFNNGWGIDTLNIPLQVVNKEFGYMEGNDYDCGVFIVYLLTALALNIEVPQNINLDLEKSKELGQILRRKFNDMSTDFNAIHETVNTYRNNMKGLNEYETDMYIEDWIHPFFGQYTKEGMENILDLRLKNLDLNNIKVVPNAYFIDGSRHNMASILIKVFQELSNQLETTFIPLNLFNKHAVGLIFENIGDDMIKIKYFDPENKLIPHQLEQIFRNLHLNIEQLNVEQQKYANCAPEVIEDFIFYLTGNRLSQEEAVPFHSYLVEQSLLDYENYNDMQLSGCDN